MESHASLFESSATRSRRCPAPLIRRLSKPCHPLRCRNIALDACYIDAEDSLQKPDIGIISIISINPELRILQEHRSKTPIKHGSDTLQLASPGSYSILKSDFLTLGRIVRAVEQIIERDGSPGDDQPPPLNLHVDRYGQQTRSREICGRHPALIIRIYPDGD